jgi:hypothetical protein
MKKPHRRLGLASETLRVLDPKDLEKAAGDSVVTTTSQLATCHSIVFAC